MKTYLFTLFILLAPSNHVSAQVYAFTGIHKSYVRNNVLANASPIYSWHIGAGVNLYPKAEWKKPSINAEFAFIEKGYNQQIGNDDFEFRFRYLTYQVALSYQVLPFLSVKGGANMALLFDTNVEKGTETYESFDFGFVGGLSFLEKNRISFYTQVVYGLSPMLKYYDIDAIGNFNGKISDLKNTCFMVGLRVNIYEKKISIWK